MKKVSAILISLVVISLASLVWYSCTKAEDLNGTIYGTVTDFASGQPLDNVNVKLRPSGETTLTGSDGTYQFNNVKDGCYTLSLSKNGYSDLNDDYTITVENGGNVRRDIQMNSLYQSLRITVDGRETDTLNFGVDPSFDRISYTIENNGTVAFSAKINASSDWMSIDRSYTQTLNPGSGETHYIYVQRKNLMPGDNTGFLYVSSGNYTKVIIAKATGVSMPVVSDPTLSSNSPYSASATVINNGGWTIVDRGFEYYVYWNGWGDGTYSISCGPGETNFQGQIPTGAYHVVKVRAFASNGVYTGYSGWVYTD